MSGLLFNSINGSPIISGQGVDIDETQTLAQREYTPGTRIDLSDGRTFVWVEASAALAAGNPVQATDVLSFLVNADVDAVVAIGGDTLTGTGDFSAITGDQLAYAWVYIDAGTGAGQVRWIKNRIDDDVIRITEPWTTALDATSDYIIVRPFTVEPKAATALASPAISQIVIAQDEFGWVQTKGMGHALADGSQDPIIAHEVVTVGTAVAGTVEGRTAAGLAVGDLQGKVGIGIVDVAALDILTPLYIDPAGSF